MSRVGAGVANRSPLGSVPFSRWPAVGCERASTQGRPVARAPALDPAEPARDRGSAEGPSGRSERPSAPISIARPASGSRRRLSGVATVTLRCWGPTLRGCLVTAISADATLRCSCLSEGRFRRSAASIRAIFGRPCDVDGDCRRLRRSDPAMLGVDPAMYGPMGRVSGVFGSHFGRVCGLDGGLGSSAGGLGARSGPQRAPPCPARSADC